MTCQRVNKKLHMMPAELHPITVNGPWHRIGIDLIGPLPITAAGMNYKFVCFSLKYLGVLLLIYR